MRIRANPYLVTWHPFRRPVYTFPIYRKDSDKKRGEVEPAKEVYDSEPPRDSTKKFGKSIDLTV